ncbi:hypothetical protein EMPS_03848 [Entomortierella parvispora]|uniref:Transcription activator GCR1-like domain-containing protein n=1 Tax=Entomortierella parvispora TaxID=205924 RepID=A0A9P3LUX2_9FUNG|nr:hypothetical protein EMPS_03848 [Entomortierella parvispora]
MGTSSPDIRHDLRLMNEETLLTSSRRLSLSDEERGLVYWEEWCQETGYETLPTWETLTLFIEEFVAPMEEHLNRLAQKYPTRIPIVASRVFIEPVLNLRRNRQHFSSSSDATSPLPDRESGALSILAKQCHQDGHEDIVPSSPSSSISFSDNSSLPFISSKPPPSIHSGKPDRDCGSDTCPDERHLSPGSARSVSSTLTLVEQTVITGRSGSDITLQSPSALNDRPHYGVRQQDQGTQHHDQRKANTSKEINKQNYQLDSKFNFTEFKLVSDAYSSTIQKATIPGLPQYGFRTEVTTTHAVLQEWRYGYKGRPAIQDLNSLYPSRWWEDHAREEYENRRVIVTEFVRLCRDRDLTTEEAVEVLEELRGDTGSLRTLVDAIRAQHYYGLTTGVRISSALKMIQVEPIQDSSKLAFQCDQGRLESVDIRVNPKPHLLSRQLPNHDPYQSGPHRDYSESRLEHDHAELAPTHDYATNEHNRNHQNLKPGNSHAGHIPTRITLKSGAENNHIAPISDQDIGMVRYVDYHHETRKRPLAYFIEDGTNDDVDFARATKSKKVKKKPQRGVTVTENKHSLLEGPPLKFPVEEGPFPLPVRTNLVVNDIWKEWTIGWEGEPSMETLIATHGRVWTALKKHCNHFEYRGRLVRVIRAAMAIGAVASAEEACAELEKLRDGPNCGPLKLILNPEFKKLLCKWNIYRPVPRRK